MKGDLSIVIRCFCEETRWFTTYVSVEQVRLCQDFHFLLGGCQHISLETGQSIALHSDQRIAGISFLADLLTQIVEADSSES